MQTFALLQGKERRNFDLGWPNMRTDAISSAQLCVSGAMLTHVGRVRSTNEDVVMFVAPGDGMPEKEAGFLALVADGMGGHAAGEVASALAADVIRRTVYSLRDLPQKVLQIAFEAANRAIIEHGAANPGTKGMGTTCTVLLICNDYLWLGHVGDSRAYLLRDGTLKQLSDDQTLHAQLIRDGIMTEAEAAKSPGGNYILQALGAREIILPSISAQGEQLKAGDLLLLCSDGLYNLVTDIEITTIMCANDPQEACRELIETALAAGGFDNISAGVFKITRPELTRTSGQAATREIKIADDAQDASPGAMALPSRG